MFLEPLITLLLIRYLRKTLQTKTALPQWDKVLLTGLVLAVALMVTGVILKDSKLFLMLIGHAMVFALAYIIIRKKEFLPARPIIFSLIPLLVISLISNLTELTNKKLFLKWEDYFDIAVLFGLIWVLAIWLINKKQRKALEQERQKTAEIEKEKEITEKIKAGLEIQVAERTAALKKQKEALEEALVELTATQSQLIQSEKMASLGELTAGIAHEIQNPLNFVNNFSEVNKELIAEMQEEIEKGNMEEVKTIVNNIAANQQKINHHGKRADAIVKGMLQHSRSSSGNKEPTDINTLADEYLRLAYHGLRAKDKTFNATLKTDYDQKIEKINIVPQDIGRVILNLINNAFYAVGQKKAVSGFQNPGLPEAYEPTVSVSTKKSDNKILISVKDNGNGIPQKVLDKIFQPFFTTKPTGQGTGLGLSLSYDIVKAHGGELKVETREGEGTTFNITLKS
jgi:two-component system, NtrC family, sensor kinase